MQSALSNVDGVKSVNVDYASGTATIQTDGMVNQAELVSALQQASFDSK